MAVKELFARMLAGIDMERVLVNIEHLWRCELGQTTRHRRQAARYVEELLRDAGLQQVERIAFPADGTTAYGDKVMPLAWEATTGTLTVVSSRLPFEDPVVADYARHPFHLVHGSVSTPPAGRHLRIITEEQLFAGQDARDAMVVLESGTHPRAEILTAILDLGGLGLITDRVAADRGRARAAMTWVTACTEGMHWHVQADDRPFIGFSVTPTVGERLRAAARMGEVTAHAVSDGVRFAGELDAVTGVIPGDDPRELWLLSHLYEPLADDNCSGVIAGIEIARAIRRLVAEGAVPPPRFTLRLVFAMEMYGFAAFAEWAGGRLHDRVIGAMNLDSPPDEPQGTVMLAPPGAPFFGDYLLEDIVARCGRASEIAWEIKEGGAYCDDMILSDPTIGVPTVWPLGRQPFHHLSLQDMSILHPRLLHRAIALCGTWAARMLTLDPHAVEPLSRALRQARRRLLREADQTAHSGIRGEEGRETLHRRAAREGARLSNFACVLDPAAVDRAQQALRRTAKRLERQLAAKPPGSNSLPAREPSRWERMTATVIPARAERGFPYDQARAPKEVRRALPDVGIYGPFAHLLANMDGWKNLRELLQQAGWETGTTFTDGRIRQYLGAVDYLADRGYLRTRHTAAVRRDEIAAALRQAGIGRGDVVMLHSSLASLGHVDGGADALIDAVFAVLGREGTLLAPTFTQSVVFFPGDGAVRRDCRPFDPRTSRIWVGQVPRRLLARDGVLRTPHPTHSVAGWGARAAELLADHRDTDAPTGRRSPFGKLAASGAKIVFAGAGLASNTFLHFLEDKAGLEYLGDALCAIRDAAGGVRMVLVPRHLPGHRDFYREPGEETKIYRRLLRDGLDIASAPLGFGEVKVVNARPMEALGLAALRDDPHLLLCDDPACLFCTAAKRQAGSR